MKRRFSIRDKLVFDLVLLSIFIISVIGALTYYMARTALLNRGFSQLDAIRTVKSRHIKDYFDSEFSKAYKLINNFDINTFNPQHGISDFENYVFLNGKHAYFKQVLDKEQRFIIDTNFRIPDGISFRDTTIFSQKMLVSDLIDFPPYYDEVILIGSKIDESKSIFSILTIDKINQIMLESSESDGFEKSAESYLVGQDYLMRSESKFWKNSVLNQEVKTIGVENGLHNQTGQEIFEDYRGIEVLSSYQRIDILGLKWVLLSEIDYREVIQPIRNLRAYILIISSIVMIFVFLLSVWIAGRFSKPIINLTNASKSIEAGEETKVYHNSNDEIRDLTESFNKMTATLIQKNHELEVEKHKRYELVLDAQEQERGRLSRELHDGIGQTFIALQLQLEFAKNSENDEKNKQIDNVISNMEASIDEIRRLSNNLMPAVLYEFGLTTAVKELINNISKYSSIAISHKIDCNIPRMDEKKTIYLYRITQEIFTNAIKYSDAENIIIKLFQNKNEIHLEIVDDGIGFDINQAEEKFGNGLYNIKERVELLNGQVRLDSQIGKGAKYSIIIPNDNE